MVLKKHHLLYTPRSDREALGLPPKPEPSEEDLARRKAAQEQRVADQKAASLARKERRKAAHEQRMKDQQAASLRRRENRLTQHKQMLEAQKKRAEEGRSGTAIRDKFLKEVVKVPRDHGLNEFGRDLVVSWYYQLPRPFAGRAKGKRWICRAPSTDEWEKRLRGVGLPSDVNPSGVEATRCFEAAEAIELRYNLCQNRLAEFYHEDPTRSYGETTKRQGRKRVAEGRGAGGRPQTGSDGLAGDLGLVNPKTT